MAYTTNLMSVAASDLTAAARIRNAALAAFAEHGVLATSIRDVAAAAQVSPGLVQHHFGTKSGLRDAVNEYVVEIASEAFAELPEGGSADDIQQQLGDRITSFVRDHPTELRYVARSIADGDQAAVQIFNAFVEIARGLWERLAERGLLRPDADLTWTPLHVVVLNLGTVLFREAIEGHLEAAFFEPAQLDRWNEASNALFRHGVYRSKA
jgi:AcrR family transcriptional regulator